MYFSDLLEETCIHPPSDDSDVSSSPQVSLLNEEFSINSYSTVLNIPTP